MPERKYRAGDSVEDICRACKLDRMHTVIAADADGRPIRVSCGYCDSEHNYRGGPAGAPAPQLRSGEGRPKAPASTGGQTRPRPSRDAFPLVSDRERIAPRMSAERIGDMDLEL